MSGPVMNPSAPVFVYQRRPNNGGGRKPKPKPKTPPKPSEGTLKKQAAETIGKLKTVPLPQIQNSAKGDLHPVDIRNNLNQQELNDVYYQIAEAFNTGRGRMLYEPATTEKDGRVRLILKLKLPSSTDQKLYNCALHRSVTVDRTKLTLANHFEMLKTLEKSSSLLESGTG